MVAATNNQVVAWKFIETESTGGAGYQGERIVWDTLRQNLIQGEGISIWGCSLYGAVGRNVCNKLLTGFNGSRKPQKCHVFG
ncbi:MAG: hypothetical protein V7L13_04590 [Nostoc sp.]|uniref:hypothetical protein n=1 Tax=Nostoc sp. TaxID=1180 RepID=UPI002FFB242A